jgi:hypothetical protein
LIAIYQRLGSENRSKSSAHRFMVIGRRMTPELSAAIGAAGFKQTGPVLLEIVSEPTFEAQLAKVAEIAARKAKGRRVPTPTERWNAAIGAFERLDPEPKQRFYSELREAGYGAPSTDELTEIAERVRCLATQNDPDAVRAGLEEIAAALERLVD